MAAKKKRGGRVTPKGTANPTKKKSDQPASDTRPEQPGQLPRRAMREKGRGAQPMTHHRGNR